MNKPAKWYSIRNLTAVAAAVAGVQVAAAAEILIYGDIGDSWYEETVTAAGFVQELQALDVDAITVRINSIGGSAPDGIAIYNAIRRHKATVTTVVDGMALSIASLIAMAGDKREMASNAMLMLHAPWTYMAGNSGELREKADELDTWAAAMATSYAAASGKSQADCLALLTDGRDHYYTAEQAKAESFIQTITDAQEPAAMAAAVSLLGVGSRYRDVPAAWLQACGGQAAAAAAAPSAASAAPTQESLMKLRNSPLLAGLLMIAAGAAGSDTGGTGTGQPAAGAAPSEPTAAQREAILAADRARRDSIAASAKPFAALPGVTDLVAKLQANASVSPEAAGTQILALVAQGTAPIAGGRVVTVEDERDKVRAAMEQSILARGVVVLGKDGPVRADASNPYRGRSLLGLAEACLRASGVKTDGMDKRALVAAAFTQSTSDFPVLLENTLHKTLQAAYAIQSDTWTRFCARGSVGDFRAHPRYRVGSLSNLDSKNELGEFKNKAIPDGEKASITATTKGNIINISREAVINDDLGAFTGLASSLGRASKRTVEAAVYAALAENAGMGPTLSDGKSLFHADHLNVSTGAPTVTSFEAARVVMRKQTDVSGNEYLELDPAVWLGPDGLVGAAKVVINSTYDPDAANKLQRANIAYNLVRDIVSTPRLAGTPWFMFADPSQAPVLEVAFLDGLDAPYVELQNGFEVDGAAWKVRLDFGVAGIDFRGAVRSTGV